MIVINNGNNIMTMNNNITVSLIFSYTLFKNGNNMKNMEYRHIIIIIIIINFIANIIIFVIIIIIIIIIKTNFNKIIIMIFSTKIVIFFLINLIIQKVIIHVSR